MKKWILICLISLPSFVLFGGNVKKQQKEYPNVKFGATAGFNYSNIISTNNPTKFKSSFLAGWNVGGYSVINFSDKLSFLPELLYTLKGASIPLGGGVTIYSHREYVEIPLQLKIFFCNHFVLLGGPYVGYLLGFSSNANDYFPNTGSVKNYGSNWDVGATISLGYDLKNGFNAGIRIERGFNNLNDPQNNINEFNEVGILYLGWTFVKFKN